MSSILGGSTAQANDPASILEAGIKAELSKNLGGNLGPFILGWSFDFILFGVMVHQLLLWVSNIRIERKFIIAIVAWTTMVSTAITVYGLWYLWTLFVTGFGSFKQFVEIDKFMWYGVLDPLTTAPVQVFFTERAYRFSGNRLWVVIVAAPLILMTLVGGFGLKIASAKTDFDVVNPPEFTEWTYVWLSAGFAIQVFLSVILAHGFLRSDAEMRSTDSRPLRLIRLSFEVVLLGTMASLAALIQYAVKPASFMNIFWEFVHSKLYVVSLLAVLNYRFTLRKTMEASQGDSSSAAKSNTFALSNRHQQETMYMDKIQVDTVVIEQSHKSPEPRVGVNRLRLPDEESGHSTAFTREVEDEFESSTRLNRAPTFEKD